MSRIEAASVNLILCDLPYGVTACKWDTVIPLEVLWKQYRRIMKPRGSVVLTASQPFTSALVMSNPKWFRCEWIWQKSTGGGFLNANRHPLKRHESVLVFGQDGVTYNPQKTPGKPYKCKRHSAGETTFDQTVAGWITENNGDRFPISVQFFKSEMGLHPTQKPVALMEYLIKTYSNEGDMVLDNCLGSGTTGVAAMNTNRNFIGIERDQKYFEIAKDRIEKNVAA